MKLQLNVPSMACGSCAKSITNAVKSVDQTAIREAIKGAGFAVS